MIDEHIYALLSTNSAILAACPRIYSEDVPADVEMPYITYQELDNSLIYTYDGASGLKNSDVIIDIWGGTKKTAIDVAEVIYNELVEYRGAMGTKTVEYCEVMNVVANVDRTTRLWGASIELNIWYK